MAIRYFILMLIVLQIMSCNREVAPVAIKEVTICSDLVNGACEEGKSYFSKFTDAFYISCILENPKRETTVTFIWYYYNNESKILLDEIILEPYELGGTTSNAYVLNAHLNRNKTTWREGKYEIEVIVNAAQPIQVSKSFSI